MFISLTAGGRRHVSPSGAQEKQNDHSANL